MDEEELVNYFNEHEEDIHDVIPYPFPDDFKAVIAKFYLEKVDALMNQNFTN